MNSNQACVELLSYEACWQRMPPSETACGGALPNWVRAVARELPRTAAAMLHLDYAQRVLSPLDPVLRAQLRWVVANANRSDYGKAYALDDLQRIGADDKSLTAFQQDPVSCADSDAVEFARLLTVDAPSIPDTLFERLRVRYGNPQVAAMVMLAAYGNFQDRLTLGLNLPVEEDGPLPPLAVRFPESALQLAPFVPTHQPIQPQSDSTNAIQPTDQKWASLSYEQLQSRLEQQRDRQPRLPIPNWDDVEKRIPASMASRPTRIVWNLLCLGYVPELAVPWSTATRTMWAEFQPDRIFEESLFWIQTRSVGCNYCMGHCEMLLEVAGLDSQAVAERTRRLASTDWSSFPPVEQRAYAYARKLSERPWDLACADYQSLVTDLGDRTALATFWWLCRGLYMTRVSDGFQLPLERENVFG